MHDFNGTADRKIELSVSAPLIDGDFGKSVRVSYQKAMRVAHLVIGDAAAFLCAEYAAPFLKAGDDAFDRYGEVIRLAIARRVATIAASLTRLARSGGKTALT